MSSSKAGKSRSAYLNDHTKSSHSRFQSGGITVESADGVERQKRRSLSQIFDLMFICV